MITLYGEPLAEPRFWSCDRGNPNFLPWPGPIVGYMQGSVFIPKMLMDSLLEAHPLPPGFTLIPVRQAPLDDAAFTLQQVLDQEVQRVHDLHPEEVP